MSLARLFHGPRTNTVRKERLSIWVNVVTDVAELLRMFFPGTQRILILEG